MKFSEMSYPEIGDAAARNALVLLPIGQTEEHGPHLPAGTDVMIAHEVAQRVADRIEEKIPVLVMDTVSYGYSVKAVSEWPGTILISADTLIDTMRQICASLTRMGFRKIAILNSHGNHPGLLEVVSRTLSDTCDVDIPVLSVGPLAAEALEEYSEGGEGASCHAGEFETSIMLLLRPDLVRTDAYPPDDRVKVENPGGPGVFWSTWRRQKSSSGVYGDPTTATAEKGGKFLDAIVRKACDFLSTYYEHPGIG